MAKKLVNKPTSNGHMTADNPWTLGASYDYRFGRIGFHISRKGSDPIPFPAMRLDEFLAKLKVSPHEIRACLLDEYRETEGDKSIDEARIRLLESVDWQGKTVLDIGGYDGFAAEIAHKGGAKRAICLDNHQYEHYGWADKRKEGVEYVQGDVMDLVIGQNSVFQGVSEGDFYTTRPDILINYNVLYHVKNPWAFLDKCREFIKEDGEMLLCTLHRYHDGPWMYVYEPRECNQSDETVYFGPSLEALERLLRFTGWTAERYALAYDRVLYRCKPTAGWQRKHEDT